MSETRATALFLKKLQAILFQCEIPIKIQSEVTPWYILDKECFLF